MTVRELRLELEKMDQDKPVIFECSGRHGEDLRFEDANIAATQGNEQIRIDIF